jgi:hypothetical protein
MSNSPELVPEIMVMLFGGTRTWSVNSAGTADPRAAVFELYPEAATPIHVTRRPFDILAEGLLSENSRGERI